MCSHQAHFSTCNSILFIGIVHHSHIKAFHWNNKQTEARKNNKKKKEKKLSKSDIEMVNGFECSICWSLEHCMKHINFNKASKHNTQKFMTWSHLIIYLFLLCSLISNKVNSMCTLNSISFDLCIFHIFRIFLLLVVYYWKYQSISHGFCALAIAIQQKSK